MQRNHETTKNRPTTFPAFLAGAGLVLALAAFGCGDSADPADATGVLEPASASAAGFESAPPSLEDLATLLGLDAGQSEVMTAALAELEQAMQNRPRPEHGRRGSGGEGQGQGGPGPEERGEPPVMTFLATCSGFLDTDQFVALAGYLAEQQEERRASMREHREDRRGGDRSGPAGAGGDGFADELKATFGITDEQLAALGDSRRADHEARRDLGQDFAAGTITAEGFRDALAALRQEREAEAESILGSDALAWVQAKGAERRAQQAEKRLEKLGSGIDARVDFLTRLLALDEGQAQQLAAVLEGALPEMRDLLGRVIAGSVTPEDELYERIRQHEATRSAVLALLDDDQAARWEAMESLRPRRGPGGGPR